MPYIPILSTHLSNPMQMCLWDPLDQTGVNFDLGYKLKWMSISHLHLQRFHTANIVFLKILSLINSFLKQFAQTWRFHRAETTFSPDIISLTSLRPFTALTMQEVNTMLLPASLITSEILPHKQELNKPSS